ncbi:F390 synthetase-related protein [Metabacillus bambusae]|uniref:Adenylate cyclase n=1 Tax=Metabacillus bambusae TaxID=2795218 RepID=A0ABS3MW79_9BACI|nr:F390 synthetase-related protein [Metabacillus bambusae]MBO1510267.1 adenylate cyclase [Metabacillus bambusae]
MNKLNLVKQYVLTKYGRRFLSKEELQRFQQREIKKQLLFVLRHSAFYREFYKDYQNEIQEHNWESLPIIDKSIMMNHFDDFNTVGIKKKRALEIAFEAERTRDFTAKIADISIGLSSGTSGNRGVFLVSDKEAAKWAGAVLAKLLPGSLIEKQKIAFFLRANNNLYSTTENGRITFQFFDLLDDFPTHIHRLNELMPTIIIAPPSMLRKLAEWQIEDKILIRPIKIVSVAEVLEDLDKRFIEEVFQQTLHQVYQCTEGFLAVTCSHGTLHMNEDLVAIQKEYLDKEKGIFVPILTDFTRTTQPIIRYRLNDILIERKAHCPCGSHFLALERIDGRCDDLFYGYKTDGGDVGVLFPDFIRRAIMLASDHILEYKVTQMDLTTIEVKLKVNASSESVKEVVISEITKLWKQNRLVVPDIHFSPYDLIPSDKKRKRIENAMRGNFDGKIV